MATKNKDFDGMGDKMEFGGDEFFPFDDKYLDSMNDGGDMGGMPKDMPNGKGVKAFFKNVAKSTKGLTMDIAKANIPNVIDFGNSLKDTVKAGRDDVSQMRLRAAETAGKLMGAKTGEGSKDTKTILKETKGKITTAIKEAGARLKSGEFYKTADENMEMGDMFGDGGDFGGGGASGDFTSSTTVESAPETQLSDEPFGESTTQTTTKVYGKHRGSGGRVAIVKDSRAGVAATMAAAESTNKVTGGVGIATINTMNNIFAKQFEVDEQRFRTHMKYQEGILGNLNIIATYVNKIGTNSVAADMKYKTKQMAMIQDQNMLLKDIKSALYYTSPQYAQFEQSKMSKILGGGGGLNGEEYWKNIKSNAGMVLGGTSLGTLAEMGGMYADMKGSMNDMGMKQKFDPMSFAIRAGTNALLSKATKQRMSTINDIFANAGGMMIGKMNQISRFSNNPIMAGIANMLGVKDSYVKKADLGLKDPNAKAVFDMKTHRSINDVIPGYLAKILAATSGQEETFYDYKSGSFRTGSSLKKQMNRNIDRAYESSYELNNMTRAMSGHAIKNDKRVKDINPAEIEKDFETIKRNIAKTNIGFNQQVISHLFRDQKLTEQLTEGTKHGEVSLQAFKNAFMQMNVEEQLMFQAQIAKVYGNVADAYKSNNRDLMQNGGAALYSGTANSEEIEELQRNLKYSNYANASAHKKGTANERMAWKRRKDALEQIERLGGGDQVAVMKGATDASTGEANTTTTAGIWASIHSLLLNGIIVYPQAVSSLPKHLAKAQSAQAAIKADAAQRKRDEAMELENRSMEIKQLQENMVKRDFQKRAIHATGLMDSLRLRGQRSATTNAANQGVTRFLNGFTGMVGRGVNGKNAKYGAGLGVMNNAYEDAYDTFGQGALSEMSILNQLSKNSGYGGVRGAVGKGASRLNNEINRRRKAAKEDNYELNSDGTVRNKKGPGKAHQAASRKKQQLVDYLANKGIFDKIDNVSRQLLGTVDALSDEEIDKIIAEQRKEDLKEIVQEQQEASTGFSAQATMTTGAIQRKRKINRVTNNYNTDNSGVVAGIGTTNELLTKYLEKETTISADLMTGTNDRLDVMTTQMATIISIMAGSGDKDVKSVSDSMINKLTKAKEHGKGFFKKIFTGFQSSTKRITDKFKKKDKEDDDNVKKHGLLGKIMGLGGSALSLGGRVAGGALSFGGKMLGKAPGAAGAAMGGISGIAGAAMGGATAILKGVKGFLFGKKDDVKRYAKEVHDAIRVLQKKMKGMNLDERIKMIEEYVKNGSITKRAGSFIMAKLKAANKNKENLDATISGLKNNAKEIFSKTKEKGKGFIQRSSARLQAAFNKHKPENISLGGVKERGKGILGMIGGAASGAFASIKGFFSRKKGGKDKGSRREGSFDDFNMDHAEATKTKQEKDNSKYLKLIYEDVHKIKVKIVGKDKNPFGEGLFANLLGGAGAGGGGDGGILGDVKDAVMNEVGDKVTDKIGGKIFGRLGKGKLGSKLFGRLGKGAVKAGEEAALKGGEKAALKAGEKALLKGGGKALLKGGARGLGALGKFAGPLGIALTAAMAIGDGVDGWKHANDIAGVEEGEQATTGQKIGSALSSSASGLTFGLIKFKDIYGAGKAVGNAAIGAGKAVGNAGKAFGNYSVGDKVDANGNMVKRSTLEKALRIGMMTNPLYAGSMMLHDAVTSKKSKQIAKKMMFPVIGRISSPFGKRTDPFGSGQVATHNGLDIAAPVGTPIKAINDGVVYKTGKNHPVLGKFVVVKHNNGVMTVHGHASQLEVKKGDKVVQGQEIAKVGSTGESTGPHIHFSVVKGNKLVDPESFVKTNGTSVKLSNPITSFYTDLTGVSSSTVATSDTDKADLKQLPLNPNATSPEEYPAGKSNVPTATMNSSNAKINSSYVTGQEQSSPNLRNTARLKESPVITGARAGQGGSEEINASLELTRQLVLETTRHNKVSENFYKAVQVILETMNDRDQKEFSELLKNADKRKRAERENKISSVSSAPRTRNNNEYGLNDYDNIATGF